MLSTAIILFREILEIAMILGVVLAATRGLPGRSAWVFGGFLGGSAGAGLVALFARAISESLSGMGQEIFNALILFTAAAFIGWTVLWLRKNARTMVADLKKTGTQVMKGKLPHYTLALIIGLAMLREGSEIVLFLYSMALSGQSVMSITEGAVLGGVAGTIAGIMVYYGLLKIPARYVLQVTSWLLFLLVAGLVSQGVGYLSAAGYFDSLSYQLWDTSWLLNEDNIVGKSLHALVGYTARPTLIQLIAYLSILAILLFLAARIDRVHKAPKVIAISIITGLLLAFTSHPAVALDEIYSPNAEPKEIAVEYSGSRTFDGNGDKNNAQEHEVAIEYGLTDRWMVEASAGFAKEPYDVTRFENIQLENRFQFFEQGENWLDSGILVAYGFSKQPQTADQLEVKLLLQKDYFDKFTTMVNVGFTQPVGYYATDVGPDYVFLANTRYRLNEWFQPGVEVQSDFGTGDVIRHTDLQEHYLGPAVYGTLFGRLKYQAAYLLGLTEASSTSAARLMLEYEMNF